MRIRKAVIGDLDRLMALERQFRQDRLQVLDEDFRMFDSPTTESKIRERLEREDTLVLVAEEGDMLVGFIVGILSPYGEGDSAIPQGKIGDVFVTKKYRGAGVASKLFEAVTRWFRQHGCEYLSLTVYADNPARQIYEHWGFRPFSVNMKRRL